MTNEGEGENKGVVESFKAPVGTPVEIFEERMKIWHEQFSTLIETGADERFQKLLDGLAGDLAMYAKKVSPVALDYMARTFDIKRSEWAQKAAAAEMEDLQEAHAAVSLRYAALASMMNRVRAMP
ncbi:MAG TPA: hypothetical protein PK109_00915 [Candidatus Paceibacterota bacterium]|nr:hypothetical protein [Candidatus Paceibacterota bacterium]